MPSALLWSPNAVSHNLSGLDQCGWEFVPTRNPLEDSAGTKNANVSVGVVAFDPNNAPLSTIQETVLGTRPIEWIALVPPNSIRDPQIKGAIGNTFYDYHTAPVRPSLFAACLGHASGMAELRRTANVGGLGASGRFSMVGRSARMQNLYRAIERISITDAPVLITGETGTGKELVARAIHNTSPRSHAPFVAVNCGALPETLIEAELFGYEKGAFTDAKARRIGRIEAAAGGTLFLDEIGDLPASVQAVLLRFLQEHTIERLGGYQLIPVDVRVVAATHLNLENLIRSNRFREDLYYRLNVLCVEVPPLRHREGDVALLAGHLLEKFARGTPTRVRGFARSAEQYMNAYEWGGNVRELINRVHRAVVMSENRLISLGDLGLEQQQSAHASFNLEHSRDDAERQALQHALAHSSTMSQASAELGVSRMTLYRLMAKHGLRRAIRAP